MDFSVIGLFIISLLLLGLMIATAVVGSSQKNIMLPVNISALAILLILFICFSSFYFNKNPEQPYYSIFLYFITHFAILTSVLAIIFARLNN